MNDKTEITKEDIDASVEFHKPLVVGEPQVPINLTVPQSPLQQMQVAQQMGMSVSEMKEMLELQKEWEANEARKAFHLSLAEFHKNPPVIIKDLINNKYGSAYSSIGNTVNKASESMGPWGLSARWDYPESKDMNEIIVTCILSHAMGHEEKVTLKGNPDKEGSKNPLQERKSARTYLKLETFEAVTGIASILGNIDDDGNKAAPVINRITENQALTLDAKITDNDLNREVFVSWLSKFFPYTKGSIDLLMEEHYQKVFAKLDATIKMLKDKSDG